MEYIAHRINTLEELRKLPQEYGVELDLRDDLNGRVYICHNPFEPGSPFICAIYSAYRSREKSYGGFSQLS